MRRPRGAIKCRPPSKSLALKGEVSWQAIDYQRCQQKDGVKSHEVTLEERGEKRSRIEPVGAPPF